MSDPLPIESKVLQKIDEWIAHYTTSYLEHRIEALRHQMEKDLFSQGLSSGCASAEQGFVYSLKCLKSDLNGLKK